jgi:hypothetical protein
MKVCEILFLLQRLGKFNCSDISDRLSGLDDEGG